MRTPYGLDLSENCAACKYRRAGFFCELSPAELNDFDALKFISAYPAGAVLFVEQQKARGIYVLCEGQVRLSFTSAEGKTLTLHIAQPGEILGLPSAFSDTPYEVTAETLRPCQIAFVSGRDFQKFLRKHPAIFQRVARRLGLQYRTACQQLRTVGLGASVLERVARFLLNWSADTGVSDGMQFTLPLNHEQMAQSIAATRESVTRTLSALSEKGLIERHRSTFVIPSRAALAEVHLLQEQAKRSAVESRLIPFTPTVVRRHVQKAQAPQPSRQRANRSKRASSNGHFGFRK